MEIYKQVEKLTANLVGLSLCNHQKFPLMRDLGSGLCEISIEGNSNVSHSLKNISYQDIYLELERTQTYNLRMLDGALINLMYLFRNNQVERHRLTFFPSPFLEEFQNNPEIYIKDEVYAEVVRKNIVPFPIRFDFDCRDGVVVEINHPKSHLTLGQYQKCRIPVSAPVTPYHFVGFILRNFYNTAYLKYCDKLTSFSQRFDASITNREKDLPYFQIPV